MSQAKVYFPGLNELRFFAAGLVVIHHLEYFKQILGLKSFLGNNFFGIIGGLGVTFFFVLSGFLITYLLLTEKNNNQTISIKKFYLRRILRIWPLYFLIVFLALYCLNKLDLFYIKDWTENVSKNQFEKTILYLLILPNIVAVLFYPVLFSSQLWSIGVEEQFYLLWPILLKYFRKTFRLLLTVIFLYITIVISLSFLKRTVTDKETLITLQNISDFVSLTRIDCMAIGGLGAYLLFSGWEKLIKFIFTTPFQILLYVLVMALFMFGVTFKYFNMEIYSIIFCLLILNISSNIRTILHLDNQILNYLGKISYGIYMYHPIGIVMVLKLAKNIGFESNIFIWNLIIYCMVFGITVSISVISYELFEKKFINIKLKYSEIISGDNAKNIK